MTSLEKSNAHRAPRSAARPAAFAIELAETLKLACRSR
jgi:hypothetical protein